MFLTGLFWRARLVSPAGTMVTRRWLRRPGDLPRSWPPAKARVGSGSAPEVVRVGGGPPSLHDRRRALLRGGASMTDDRPPQPGDSAPGPTGAPTAEPPPMTAFAWRNGLVRPKQGRLLSGVCGALARATNTDPILWRVVIAVLTIFGGFGVLLYLLGWLLLPADGDTASPVEALLGRGYSATSKALTIIAGVVALISVGAFVSEPFRPGIFGAILLGAAALLLLRDQRGRSRPAPPPP